MRRSALLLFGLLCACGGSPRVGTVGPAGPEPPPSQRTDDLELVESWPAGTTLDHPEIPDAADVWVEMIDDAVERIDFLEFYGASVPNGRLEPVIEAIERAAERGVHIRFVFDQHMLEDNAEVPARLEAIDGVEVRIYDFSERGGGVQHAKVFVVDGDQAFLGSQNFDWRSLEHNQELGVRVRAHAVVDALDALFQIDWALAGGAELQDVLPDDMPSFPATATFRGEEVRVTPRFSPRAWLPDEGLWEWTQLREWIEGAQERIRLQVMGYHLRMHDDERWLELDDALRAAAARGVTVELMVSNWETRPGRIEDLKALHDEPNVEVRIVTIPEAEQGFIPYARTIHAKYMTVDGRLGWLSTSNASGDYFLRSRNAGLFVEGAPFATALDGFFEDLWTSPYAEAVDLDRVYEPPRVGE